MQKCDTLWLVGKEDTSNTEYQEMQGMINLEYESDGMLTKDQWNTWGLKPKLSSIDKRHTKKQENV